MAQLVIANNSNLGGQLPPSWGGAWDSIEVLDLSNNALKGARLQSHPQAAERILSIPVSGWLLHCRQNINPVQHLKHCWSPMLCLMSQEHLDHPIGLVHLSNRAFALLAWLNSA